MSYILDALRRADAQRTRDLLPGAAASTTRVVFADTQPYRRGLPWPAIAIACALLLAAFVAWHFWPAAAPASPAARAQPALPAPATPVVMQPTTPAIAQPAPVVAPATQIPAPLAAPPVASAAARPASAPARAGTAAPTATDNRVPTLDELPAALRAELPKLAINGSAYSGNAAHRLLIINGQVLHEKDEVGGGVVLEQIQPRAAVLRYKGQRFQLAY